MQWVAGDGDTMGFPGGVELQAESEPGILRLKKSRPLKPPTKNSKPPEDKNALGNLDRVQMSKGQRQSRKKKLES